MKDPAFLFYTKDFYEGTRMMLPEERACFVDLLIYQHQNGVIPNDLKRVLMYCSGVSEATLIATLEAKFKHTSKGWVNSRLEKEIFDRESFKNEQSKSGKIGQFWKKIYQIFSKNEISTLKNVLSKELIISILNDFDITNEDTLKGSLKQRLSIIIENANENINKGKGKKSLREKEKPKLEIPSEIEFIDYGLMKLKESGIENSDDFEISLKLKYQSWKENDWKTGGEKPREIKNWKTTLLNTLEFLKPIQNGKSNSKNGQSNSGRSSGLASFDTAGAMEQLAKDAESGRQRGSYRNLSG